MDLSKDPKKRNQDILLIQLSKIKILKKQLMKKDAYQFQISLQKLIDQNNVM